MDDNRWREHPNDEGFDEETLAFFQKHQGGSGNVWLVQVMDEGRCVREGIFSSQDKASTWLDSLPPYETSVCIPYVVDIPDYGNAVLN